MKPGATMSDAKSIARAIAGVVRARDGRGGALNEAALYARLLPNTTPTIAYLCAQAARRVGECIARMAP